MKKITFLFFALFLTIVSFAQTQPGAEEKNAGNAAWKAKNYMEAFTKFEAYLKAVEFKDQAYVYNTATAALKAKKYAEAEKYYLMSIKNRYKTASSYKGVVIAMNALKKSAEVEKILDQAMKDVPGNAAIEKSYAIHFLKLGQAAQKSNKESVAVANYKKIASMANKGYKIQGLMSLANLYFNNGAKIMQDVTPLANKDKAKYDEGKKQAAAKFEQAKTFVEQARSIEPANADVKALMTQIANALK